MLSFKDEGRDGKEMVWNVIKWVGLAGLAIGALIAIVVWFDLDKKRF